MLIGNAVPPLLSEAVALGLVHDLTSKTREEMKGELLSFVPALSSGRSPALRHVTNMIETEFGLSSRQMELL